MTQSAPLSRLGTGLLPPQLEPLKATSNFCVGCPSVLRMIRAGGVPRDYREPLSSMAAASSATCPSSRMPAGLPRSASWPWPWPAGTLARGAMRLSATQEAHLDLLIEQTVYLGTAIQLAFDTGVANGLPPEALALELYMSGEMSRTFQTFAEVGFYRSATCHGLVAQYGGFLGALALDRREMSRMFGAQASRIIGGDFAVQLQAEKDAGYPTRAVIEAVTKGDDPLSQAEARVRKALGER